MEQTVNNSTLQNSQVTQNNQGSVNQDMKISPANILEATKVENS